jgi:hypothetical protein
MGAGQLAGVAFGDCGELDGAYCGPVLFPSLLGDSRSGQRASQKI